MHLAHDLNTIWFFFTDALGKTFIPVKSDVAGNINVSYIAQIYSSACNRWIQT